MGVIVDLGQNRKDTRESWLSYQVGGLKGSGTRQQFFVSTSNVL